MGKLNDLAKEMRSDLEMKPQGAIYKPLARGLKVVMQRTQGNWRLALGREGVDPSEMEIEICKAAFRVPPGCHEERVKKPSVHPKTKRTIQYHVVNLTWREEVREYA